MRPRWLVPFAPLIPFTIVPLLLSLIFVTPLRAQRLPPTAVPEHYDLAFVVDIPGKRFEGTETIRVRLGQPTTRIVLHAAEIAFHEVTIMSGVAAQDATVALDRTSETATLRVASPVAAGVAEIRIRYSGVLNDRLRGFYIAKGEKRNHAVTQFESTDARRAFPSFDEPAYKATFAVTLTIDRGDMAISNGRLLSDTPGPTAGQYTVRFAVSPKMSTYLVAIAVGDFECLEGGADGTPIRVCTGPGKKNLARIALESAEDILEYFNAYYAIAYPFEKLDMLAVPDFAAWAMENTAAIFFRERALLADTATASIGMRRDIASTIAHEIAHQWFGDLVTMQWWDDLWLNEGFATWMENRPMASAHPEWNVAVDEARANQQAFDLDSLRSTRSINTAVRTPDEIESLFDAVSYRKGGAVLRMIEHYVGADRFRDGVNAYLNAHAYGNATSEDFWTAIATTSGKPVDKILPTFINQPGVPLVEISSLTCAGGKTHATFSQERFLIEPGAAHTATTWELPACIKTSASTGSSTCLVISQSGSTLDVAQGCVQWIFANAGAQGYYRTAYAPAILRALAPRIADALTAPERLTLIDDEWALVRAGRHSAADYLTLASAYSRESSSDVLTRVTERLAFIHEYLTTDTTRPRFEAFIRGTLRPLFAQFGFVPSPSDTDEQRALRSVVIGALGTMGGDSGIVRQARTALDRALVGTRNGSPIDPTLKESVVQIAARHGDRQLYGALAAAADRAMSPDERALYLHAATDFRDQALIDRALRRALTTDLRAQDTARYLASFFENPAARLRAWSFIKTNWNDLQPNLRVFSTHAILVRALDAFCDAGARDDIRSFFAAHRLPGVTGALHRTLERINNCIDLREKQTGSITAWLANPP